MAGGWSGEVRRTRRSGESFDNHLSVNPVTGREGRVIGVIDVNRDITERKKAEAELLLRNQELESLVYIASVLVQGGSFQDKCADALQQLALSVQAELVTLRVFDEETDRFRLISQGGPAQWARSNAITRDSVTGQAFETGVPVVVNDYLESPLASAEEIKRRLRSVERPFHSGKNPAPHCHYRRNWLSAGKCQALPADNYRVGAAPARGGGPQGE